MVKWNDLYKDWPMRKPKFWSICNWFHRGFPNYYWYHDHYGNQNGISCGTFCKKCEIWWPDKEQELK